MAKKKSKKKNVTNISRDGIKELMVYATVNPTLIGDFAHVTHTLLSALDFISNHHNTLVYHFERKIKMLSIPRDISELTNKDFRRIQEDDERERSANDGTIKYLDSMLEQGEEIMEELKHLINVELDNIFYNHIELDDDICSEIKNYAIGIFAIVCKTLGYKAIINTNKL